MADYHYVSTWQLQAPIEQVWTAINDLEHLPAWYRGVQEVQTLTPGDDQGIGRRVRYVIKGRLPMRLAFEATITRSDPAAGAGTAGRGGAGRDRPLVLDQQGDVTTARYLWDVARPGRG